MKKVYLLVIGLFVSLGFTLLAVNPDTAYAAKCGGVETVMISCGSNDNPVWSILLIIMRVLAGGVGIVAVGGIVYAAFLYTTAGDNANQITISKNNIQSVVIGLIVFASLYAMVEFIVPGGVFNRSYSLPNGTTSSTSSNSSGSNNNSGSSGSNSNKGIKEARIKVGAYNVLGFDHNTSASRYTNTDRMRRAAGIIEDNGVQVFVASEINNNEQRSLILNSLSNWAATSRQSNNQDVFIYWNKDVFKAIKSGTYNIPVMPGSPSRPQPWVRLEHRKSKRQFFIYGNHLAQTIHGNNQNIGASTTVGKIKNALQQNNKFVAVLAGDMNTNDKRGYAYTIFKNSDILKDSRHSTGNKIGDNCDTHHALGRQECRPTRGSHIDHIWVSKSFKNTVESYRVVANDETAHISDHNPIIVTIKVPASK